MRSTDATLFRFLLTLGAWTLAGQALLANTAVSAAVVVPFSRWQGTLAERYLLGAPLTVSVDATCSGLDVLALCLAATLSYPVAWRRRLGGALIGIVLLLSLNLLRIAMLAGASQTPWFQTLHVNVWPTLLVAAAAGWVVLWIRTVDRADDVLSPIARRFALWTAGMLAAYVVIVPVLAEWQILLGRAGRRARGRGRAHDVRRGRLGERTGPPRERDGIPRDAGLHHDPVHRLLPRRLVRRLDRLARSRAGAGCLPACRCSPRWPCSAC